MNALDATLLVLKGGVGSAPPLGNQNAAKYHEPAYKTLLWHVAQLKNQRDTNPKLWEQTIGKYSSDSNFAKAMNKHLRGVETPGISGARLDRVKQQMLDFFTPLERDVLVWRGTERIPTNGFTQAGFTSTSLSEESARNFASWYKTPSIVSFTIPKGTNVGFTNSYGESEIILPPNTSFILSGKSKNINGMAHTPLKIA